MEKKIIKILNGDIECINELNEFLLRIINPNLEDFNFYINKLNKLENDTFFISNIRDIDMLSLIKKIFQIIDRNRNSYYEYKSLLFTILTSLEKLYSNYIENGIDENEKHNLALENELLMYQTQLSKIIESKNKFKKYYYIKIELDTKVPYFYLSRRTILLNLLQYGKPYNYTPSMLDDDTYGYLILDYRASMDVDVDAIFKELKKQDEAIVNYSIFSINSSNNLYNIKFFVNEKVNMYSCLVLDTFKFIDIIHYENFYDTYVESTNQRYILESLFKVKNNDIFLVTLKKISDREVKIFLPNGINTSNINKIKSLIKNILIDKNISEILYSGIIDFSGFQMLEYLGQKYNIEYGSIN